MIACVSEGNVFPKKKRKENVNFMSGLSPCVPEENEKTRGDKNKADLTHTLKHTQTHNRERPPLQPKPGLNLHPPAAASLLRSPGRENEQRRRRKKDPDESVCFLEALGTGFRPGPYSSVSEPGRKDTGCRSKPGGFFFSSSTLIHINKGPNHVTAQTTPTESWLSESSRGVTVKDGGLPE